MDKERKGKLVLKICCVLAAMFLWLYISNTQNPLITYTVKKVPVEIKNEDILAKNKLTLVKKEQYYVDIKIQGRSSDVYRTKASDFKVVADLSGYIVRKGENKIPVEVQNMPSSVSIVNNGNLWVELEIDEIIERTVAVSINIKGDKSDDRFIKDTIASPKEVKVTGPSKNVNLIDKAVATIDVSKLSESKTLSAELVPVNPSGAKVNGVELDPPIVHVSIGVNLTKEVPIQVDTIGNLGDRFKLEGMELSKDKVKILGEEKLVRDIKYLKTETVDLSSLTGETIKEVKLIIPQGIDTLDNIKVINVKLKVKPKESRPNAGDDQNTEQPTSKKIEKEISAKINMINIQDNITANIDKEKISFKVSGDENIIKNLSENNFKAYVDLKNVNSEGQKTMAVTIELPHGVTLVSKEFSDVKVDAKRK